MNINRHNYETFFLLYVDNELSAAERKSVELFVQENPDLQMELSLLQDTVLRADETAMDKKEWLYKEEGISSLQENLLMYADDELVDADRRTVEALLATDKAASVEWGILRQTKLEADASILFENKGSLYRKEESGKVVAIRWWRVAAAAILLGFGVWTGISVYKNNRITTKAPGELAGVNGDDKNKAGQKTAGFTGNSDQSGIKANSEATAEATTTVASLSDQSTKISGQKNAGDNKEIPGNNGGNLNVSDQGNNRKEDNNLPKPSFENINRIESNTGAIANVKPENNISASGVNDVVVKPNPVITDPATTTAAIPVVYTDEDNNNNNRFLYMDEDRVKRTKLGGFIRKAKRLLERNANIKTGDGLKVAGFEIALK